MVNSISVNERMAPHPTKDIAITSEDGSPEEGH